jgi:hypothetical protein
VPDQRVQLDERAGVEQLVDPLAGGLAALGVLALHRGLAAGVHRGGHPLMQVGQLARGGVDVGLAGGGAGRVGQRLGGCAHGGTLTPGSPDRSTERAASRRPRTRRRGWPAARRAPGRRAAAPVGARR